LSTEGTNIAPSDPERRNLRLLRRFEILDTETEAAFDNLTQLAGVVCEAPISLISLVDEDLQWFKSRRALATGEKSRSIAFCSYAIGGSDLMIVTDASTDHRFKDNPLVTLDPKIRFYAGAALTAERGVNLGTLCVIDQVPHELSRQQIDLFKLIRDQVVCQLNLRRLTGAHRKLNGVSPES
jgi:GAF domain-containing protein